MTYSGFYGLGIKEIWDMIYEYFDFVKENGYFDYRRLQQNKYWMRETINNALLNNFYNDPVIQDAMKVMEQRVQSGEKTSFMGASELLKKYYDSRNR